MAKNKGGKSKAAARPKQRVRPLGDDEEGNGGYKKNLRALQIELVKLQKSVIKNNLRLCIVIEGRDGAGKDGLVKRIIQHLSPRETRMVALPKPSDRETHQWYYQRFVHHLPAADEVVLFNRSWYNRAGVEPVMGFCTASEHERFLESVIPFETMLADDGIMLFKYYLDISRGEQKRRLADRRKDPLKQWKVSPIDAVAIQHWDDYSNARNEMFLRTHHSAAPWRVVHADDKRLARLNTIRDILSRVDYEGRKVALTKPDPKIVFPFSPDKLVSGIIAP
jgi:polyphosphate kinase 2